MGGNVLDPGASSIINYCANASRSLKSAVEELDIDIVAARRANYHDEADEVEDMQESLRGLREGLLRWVTKYRKVHQ